MVENGWGWCDRCQGAWYWRESDTERYFYDSTTPCPAGEYHSLSGRGYVPAITMWAPLLSQEHGWRRCANCRGLFLGSDSGPDDAYASGVCPAHGDPHFDSGGRELALDYLENDVAAVDRLDPSTSTWRRCIHCQVLFDGKNVSSSRCPVGPDAMHVPDMSKTYLFGTENHPLGDIDHAELLIVAPDEFDAAVQRLLDHKNLTMRLSSAGLSMYGASNFYGHLSADPTGLNDPSFVDDAEAVKRLIVFAHRQLGGQYVMLCGDASKVPVRYRSTIIRPGGTNWRDQWFVPADNYYANLYKNHHLDPRVVHDDTFSTWDDDGDGRYNAQWWGSNTDEFAPDGADGYPDIAVARLPAHTVDEVDRYVTKVINYETVPRDGYSPPSVTFLLDGNLNPDASDFTTHIVGVAGIDNADSPWQNGANAEPYGRTDDHFLALSNNWPAGVAALDALVRTDRPLFVSEAANTSLWLVYVGHGAVSGLDIAEQTPDGSWHGIENDWVSSMTNENLPVVFASACLTGQFTTCPPDGPYMDMHGTRHNFFPQRAARGATVRNVWANGDHVLNVLDFGSNDPGVMPYGSNAVSVIWQSNASNADHAPGHPANGAMITPPYPGPYDMDRHSASHATAWLFAAGGGIAYFGDISVTTSTGPANCATRIMKAYGDGASVIGDAYVQGTQKYWVDFHGNVDAIVAPRIYLSYLHLFGDPSLRLPDAR